MDQQSSVYEKIKETESERNIEAERKYNEELKIDTEQEIIKLLQHIDMIENVILQITKTKTISAKL